MWLAAHVKSRWPAGTGGLAVVTHDRWFLDEVCTHTWEVHDGVVEPFEGGYAAYVLQRVERDRQAAAAESRRRNLMRKELAWLRRGAPARTSKPKFRIDAANALIEREPPVRDSTALVQLATARLGKDVVDLLDVSVSFGDNEVLRDVEWRIGPGERAGILGVNGAGKSTLLGLVTGTVQPTSGRVKRGKTVQVGSLSQTLAELEPFADDRVSDVIAKQRTSFVAAGQELSPGQLLERLGFSQGQLATPVRDLSGGQKRRLQLLVVLLAEPNVLILDEPTNDLDTDMLAAIEDLLDSWPGTLLVVSHDRYLVERVTDHQFAVLDGRLRHLPGGVDEYLRLRAAQESAPRPGRRARRDDLGREAAASGPQGGRPARAPDREAVGPRGRAREADGRGGHRSGEPGPTRRGAPRGRRQARAGRGRLARSHDLDASRKGAQGVGEPGRVGGVECAEDLPLVGEQLVEGGVDGPTSGRREAHEHARAGRPGRVGAPPVRVPPAGRRGSSSCRWSPASLRRVGPARGRRAAPTGGARRARRTPRSRDRARRTPACGRGRGGGRGVRRGSAPASRRRPRPDVLASRRRR